MTKVNFKIYPVLEDDNKFEEISEEMLDQRFEDYRDILFQQEVLNGAIVIEVQGQPTLRIEDELWSLVVNLCFDCIPALLEEEKECFLYRFTSYTGHIVMIRLATFVRLIGEYIPAFTDEMKNLLPALFDCGIRFIRLLERLGGESNVETGHYLQSFADKALVSLKNHQMR